MELRKIVLAVCVVALVYGTFRGISCVLRTDEDIIRGLVAELTTAFADGDVGDIQACLTDDFRVKYRARRMSRDELVMNLRSVFFRSQERLILDGAITRIDLEEDKALVVWEGEVTRRSASGIGSRRPEFRGTGELEFRKEGGSWLLASAAALRDRDR